MNEQATPLLPRFGDEVTATYKEPLTPTVKRALLALVIFFHVGGGWALTQVEPVKLIVGDIAPMEVRMVAAEQAPQPQPDLAYEEPPPPPDLKPPPPDLATIVDPPPPDLPPPVFPLEAPLPEPPKPKVEHEPPKPKPPPPKPVQKPAPAPRPPADAQPQQAVPAPAGPPAAPKTVSASQLGYLVPPNPIYPARSRKAGEEGKVMIRVLVDVSGRPSQVSLQASSGHSALDESALGAVRAAQFRPYAEGGLPQAVWVLIPINFVLR